VKEKKREFVELLMLRYGVPNGERGWGKRPRETMLGYIKEKDQGTGGW